MSLEDPYEAIIHGLNLPLILFLKKRVFFHFFFKNVLQLGISFNKSWSIRKV